MGSLSLIIVLIIVVWVIVLAPIVMGNSKPIRQSGDGYDATRVVHSGGSEPVAGRRRPRLMATDVHHYGEDEGYEVVDAVEEQRLRSRAGAERSGSTALTTLPVQEESADEAPASIDGEVLEDNQEHTSALAPSAFAPSGSTVYSTLSHESDEQLSEDHTDYYELDDSFASPADFGYRSDPRDELTEGAESTQEPARSEETAHTSEQEASEHDASEQEASVDELTEEELAFASARRGRGGWDPQREQAHKADRFQRRQRTLLALIGADVIAFVAAFVVGGWVWVFPVLTIALTIWFMSALRSVVMQERALHARRIRQLRRARLGVLTTEASPAVERQRRRPGAVIVEMDDESPDFSNLPTYNRASEHDFYEYDDYKRPAAGARAS